MKTPFKLRNKRQYLAIIGGLALAISLPGVLPATAQTTPIPAAITMPAVAATTTAAATSKPAASTAQTTTPPVPGADQGAALSDYNNWVTLGIGSTFVTGDKAQFQREQNTKAGVFGGVEDFHWQEFVLKNSTLTVDGHAMVENHDYAFKFDLTDPNVGYIRAGYTEYRVWYDGNGGYWPVNNLSFSPYDQDLYVDRRSGWVEAGLTMPDMPAFNVRYEYDSRIGTMDSTEWGPTSLTPGGGPVKIVPSFLGIDETRNIFQGNVTDKIDNTDMGLTLRYELDSTKDSTFADQNPNTGPATNLFLTDYDIEKNDIFNVHGFQETFFNDKVTFSSGFSYSNTDTNMGGSRMFGTGYSPAIYAPGLSGSQYIDLGGLGSTNEYVMNMNLMLTPIKDLVIIPAVRLEYQSSDLGDGEVLPPGATSVENPAGATAHNWTSSIAESLEARYTGLRDWSLYANVELSQDWGNDAWDEATSTVVPNPTAILNQDWSRLCQKYTVGANWYPLSNLNFGTQYYHQIHDYDYSRDFPPAVPVGTPTPYPGYLQNQEFTTDDMNIRATWQALSNLTLVTRYDFQYETVDTYSTPYNGVTFGQAGTVQSSDITNHIISENISWTPLSRLCLQAGGSYVINTVNTPVAGSAGINNIVPNSEDNYWTVDASIGYALDDKTDLRVQYDYYRADDYVDNAASTAAGVNEGIPLGADTEEHNVTATLTHQFNKQLEGSLKYAYSNYRDGLSGGQDNYESNLIYASMKYGF